jgi:hypothetical protein
MQVAQIMQAYVRGRFSHLSEAASAKLSRW